MRVPREIGRAMSFLAFCIVWLILAILAVGFRVKMSADRGAELRAKAQDALAARNRCKTEEEMSRANANYYANQRALLEYNLEKACSDRQRANYQDDIRLLEHQRSIAL